MLFNINEVTTDEYYDAKRKRIERQKDHDEKRGSGYESQYGDSRYNNVAINNNRPSSHVELNPKHKNAKSIEMKREKYGSLMPASKTPSERRLYNDRDKEKKEIRYAKDVTDKKFTHGRKFDDAIVFDNEKYDLKQIQDAERAARRHYRKHLSECICLFGEEADSFLEEHDICIYQNSISIGEHTFDGYDGQCILAENGIYLYEDHIIVY